MSDRLTGAIPTIYVGRKRSQNGITYIAKYESRIFLGPLKYITNLLRDFVNKKEVFFDSSVMDLLDVDVNPLSDDELSWFKSRLNLTSYAFIRPKTVPEPSRQGELEVEPKKLSREEFHKRLYAFQFEDNRDLSKLYKS